jgi:quercetin dioxygenase-like cupin family protein
MTISFSRRKLMLVVGLTLLASGVIYAAIPVELWVGNSAHIGLWRGPATLTARTLRTPAGETTGAWHYHPGFVFNVVRQGAITVEDGCGAVNTYSAGQAFETSEGRVHRAYNLGSDDALESNMFVGPPGRPITVPIPNNEQRCGPPSSFEECRDGGWEHFNHPHSFANQFQCMVYVLSRPRVALLVPADPLR